VESSQGVINRGLPTMSSTLTQTLCRLSIDQYLCRLVKEKRNRTETKQDETNRNEKKHNETEQGETNRNETVQIYTKRNKTIKFNYLL
jgi:hypothetical protein